MSKYYCIDIETAANDRVKEYASKFEKEAPVEEPEEGKKKKKASTRTKAKKSDKAGLSFLTGKVVSVAVKLPGQEPMVLVSEDEKEILQELKVFLDEHAGYTCITFNGSGFDLDFIYLRALGHGVQLGSSLPRGRFNKKHYDLYTEILGGKWGSQQCRLEEMAWYFGCHDDCYGSGSMVQDWYDAGKLDDIAMHNAADVVVTEKIYLATGGQ